MKIGFISRGSPDYLTDIVLDGLIRSQGRENVSVDCNFRSKPGAWGPYQHLCCGIDGPEPFDIHDAEVLIASVRSLDAMACWKQKTGKSKIAIIDGEDVGEVDKAACGFAKVYFKREYFHFVNYPANVRPLPFGAIPETIPESTITKHHVFYSGHDNHPFRKEIKAVLASMGYPHSVNQDKKGYNKAISESMIGISIRGMGWDTYRYWEVPYFGATLLTQKSPQVINGNFVDGHEAVFYETAFDFRRKLMEMLSAVDRTEKIGVAGHKAVMERHLSIHRAKTVLEAIA